MDEIRFLNFESAHIPLVIQSRKDNLKLTDWINGNKALIEEKLLTSGAVLFRGFVAGEEYFPAIIESLCTEPLEYVYGSTPRTRLESHVYTATEYPARFSIPFHNEEAYQRDWPMRLLFLVAQPASKGGETPLADTVRTTNRIDPQIVKKFALKKVLYVRNYGTGPDISWEKVFQTQDREEVERFCRLHEIEFEWRSNGRLRTSQICQAVATHPKSGQTVWFNQAHLFHVSSLDSETRKAILSIYQEQDLPRNAYYGDGSPIEEDVLEHVRSAFRSEATVFSWKLHDLLLLDNMLISHARNPYEGSRKVLVGMGDPFSKANIGPTAQVLGA